MKITCGNRTVELEIVSQRQPIVEPHICPVCGGETNKDNRTGAMTKCMNPNCSAKAVGKVKRWVKSLDILGIGDDLLANMSAAGINSPLDLYTVSEAKLTRLPSGNGVLGSSRAKAILSEIQAKGKNLTVDEFLGSLGISFLGKRRVQIVREKANGALDQVEAWLDGHTIFECAKKCSIGGTVSAINTELQDNVLLIENLLKYVQIKPIRATAISYGNEPTAMAAGIDPTDHIASATTMKTPTTQYTIVLTGAMSRKRNEIAADIIAAGHLVKDSVTAGVTHLAQSDPTSQSSKTKKANSLGVAIISEAQLMEVIL